MYVKMLFAPWISTALFIDSESVVLAEAVPNAVTNTAVCTVCLSTCSTEAFRDHIITT